MHLYEIVARFEGKQESAYVADKRVKDVKRNVIKYSKISQVK